MTSETSQGFIEFSCGIPHCQDLGDIPSTENFKNPGVINLGGPVPENSSVADSRGDPKDD